MAAKRIMKPKRVWLYLGDAEQKQLDAIMEIIGPQLHQTEIISMITCAGLKALAERNYRILLPLKFKVVEENHGKQEAGK